MSKTMIYLKDIQTGEIFEFKSESDSQIFCDQYENPSNLISPNVYYTDGSGWNGKISRLAFGTNEKDMKICKFSVKKTNNEMEYLAVITAMYSAEPDSLILTDSQLVVNQCTKDWKCNFKSLVDLRDKAKELMKNKNLSLKWINRKENLAGRILER